MQHSALTWTFFCPHCHRSSIIGAQDSTVRVFLLLCPSLSSTCCCVIPKGPARSPRGWRDCAWDASYEALQLRHLSHTHTLPNTLFPPGKEGVGVSEGGVFAPGRAWQLRAIGWQQGGDSSYLYLWEGVPLVIVRLQIRINFSFFFQQTGEVEVGQHGWEVKQRLHQDSEHGAYHVVERGESRRVAPRWGGTCCASSLFSCPLIASQVLWLGRDRSEIEAPHKSPLDVKKVEVEWGSGLWLGERSHSSPVRISVSSCKNQAAQSKRLLCVSRTCRVHCPDRFIRVIMENLHGLMHSYVVLKGKCSTKTYWPTAQVSYCRCWRVTKCI